MSGTLSRRLPGPARLLLAFVMTAVGVAHFAVPEPFLAIIPAFLPAPLLLVQLSGVAEIALGLGLLHPRTRRLAGLGLVALYIAIFPANLNQAIHQISFDPAHPIAAWKLWLRLPFQILFIAWALYVSRDRSLGSATQHDYVAPQ